MEGGYQILNLGRINITSTAKKVPGAYDYIEKNLQHKVVLLEGLKLDGKLYDSIFTTFAKSYGNYIGTFTIDAKLYSVVISADDLVHTKRLIPVGDDTIELVEAMIADPWESDEVYNQGVRVTRKHSLYELTADSSFGEPPESTPGKWKKINVASGGGSGSERFNPDTDWVNVIGTANSSYTVPKDGWIQTFVSANASAQYPVVRLNGKTIVQASYGFINVVYFVFRVYAGDVVTTGQGAYTVKFCEQSR